MRPADLWRQSSFRLAFAVMLAIMVALLLASGIAYGLMQAQLTERQDARVTEIFSALTHGTLISDEADLIDAINARIAASPDLDTVFALHSATGALLVGNMDRRALPEGWVTLAAAEVSQNVDIPYRAFTGRAGSYRLTVGLSNADLDELQESVLSAFAWAAGATLIATLLFGSVLALRVQKHIVEVEEALGRVSHGDLMARLPMTGRGDDLDRISAAVNASLARLEGLVEAMQQVSADIAHDLRTPLHRLRIRLEDAASKLAEGDAAACDIAAAITQSDAIDETFAALLRIAQIEGGARRAHFTAVDIAALLRSLVEVYGDVAEDAGQSLHFASTPSAWIMGDKDLLTQAFANLIENAIRHGALGTQITCALQISTGHITAILRDTGPGIPAPERDKVLRRLYRLEKSRTSDGSGLGLSLVKAVADLHGAKLTLTDAEPGLCVTLQFVQSGGA